MNNSTALRLFKVGFGLAVLSLGAFVVIGFVLVVRSHDGIVRDPSSLAYCVLGFFTGLILAFAGGIIDAYDRHRRAMARQRGTKRPTIALAPREKPPGYNKAVLGWFFGGPELREPNEDFAAGFAARAAVPPPKKRRSS